MASHPETVALFGATGLVGSRCLELLLSGDAFTRIIVTGRRRLSSPPSDPRVVEHVVDFDDLAEHPETVRADAIICALGTTIKKAGSRKRFREVDYGFPLAIARLGLQEGVRHFLLVSALGADPDSRIFYNRVKGEVERDVTALGYPALTVVRPSLLLGERGEFRLGEEMAKRLLFLAPARYRPIDAAAVARTLVHEAQESREGTHVIESREMRRRFG